MGILDLIAQRIGGRGTTPRALSRHWTDDGVIFQLASSLPEPTIEAFRAAIDQSSADETFLAAAYLSQLVVEDRCNLTPSGVMLPWPLVYELMASPEHAGVLQALELPPMSELKPILDSVSMLAEPEFDVVVDGWVLAGKEAVVSDLRGAVAVVAGAEALLPSRRGGHAMP